MKTKQCKRCLHYKPLTEFKQPDLTKKRIRASFVCFGCLKNPPKSDDPEQKLERRKKFNSVKSEYRDRNRRYVYDYLLTHPCIDCGEKDPIVLEFDHIDPSEKKFNVCKGIDFGLDSLKEEMSKCEVRCANCHRRKTAKQLKYKALDFV